MLIAATSIASHSPTQAHLLCKYSCRNVLTVKRFSRAAGRPQTKLNNRANSTGQINLVCCTSQTTRPKLSPITTTSSSSCEQTLRRATPFARHSMHRSMACPAYVGEATPSAGEYHCNDFDWEEHRQEVLEQLATRQVLAASSAPAESALPAGKGSSHMRAGSNIKAMPLQTHHDQLSDGSQPDARSCHGSMKVSGSSQSSSSSVAADSPQQLPQARSTVLGNLESVKHQRKQPEVDETAHDVDTDGISQGDATVSKAGQGQWQYDSSCWESFHAKDNATARFYKERRYLLLEFPCLMVQEPPQHFMEIGCGCGSSLLPVLKANPTCRVTGTDLSPTAVRMFESAACKAGIAQDRITAFAADSAEADAHASFPAGSGKADAVLLIFTLAALAPPHMPAMLQAAFQALKPGGLLLIRDHGLYDLTHLRLSPEQQLSERLYRRLDGTMCYFFTTEDLQEKAEAAGFEWRECTYACVNLRNRKTQTQMKRVFVHGVFARPE